MALSESLLLLTGICFWEKHVRVSGENMYVFFVKVVRVFWTR